MDAALGKLRGRSRAKRTMWSRRAQELPGQDRVGGSGLDRRSGCATCSANTGQPEQSYSERQIYQAALDRFVREYAAVRADRRDDATSVSSSLLAA